MPRLCLLAALLLPLAAGAARAEATFTVQPAMAPDEKSVLATVESLEIVPARVRTGGTIATLSVKEGDRVERDQVLAVVADQKLFLQHASLDAQIAGLQSQLAQTQADLARAATLFKSGDTARAQIDQLTTAVNVASNLLKARTAERGVLEQQMAEGQVLAPTPGRVLKVPVTVGTVVMSGEPVAIIAEQDFVLRLRVPESHARYLKAGDPVRIAGQDLTGKATGFGTIALVYPQIEDGRVIADAKVPDLGDYFVGERVRVWVEAGNRLATIVPAAFIATRFGIDYARLKTPAGAVVDVPVQRGRERPRPDMPDAIEILAGLQPGDVLVRP